VTPTIFHAPRTPCAPAVPEMCEATIEAREDVRRVWWLTVEYPAVEPTDERRLQDELHVELVDPPGEFGASRELFREFEWARSPVGHQLGWTFTPQMLLRRVRAVAELVVERHV
jgi:hypothetical protein